MHNLALEKQLNQKLNSRLIADYCPNGLQVEGKSEIRKIITGVTASQALIDYAVAQNADALLVHHGYFWKNEDPCIRGMKGNRIRKLLTHGINLYAYHLPLDVHPELGNNAQLAALLGIENLQPLEQGTTSIPMWGNLKHPLTGEQFVSKTDRTLFIKLVSAPAADRVILILPHNKAVMLLLLVKCLNKPSIVQENRASIFLRLVIMRPNGMGSKPWENG